MAEMIKFYKGLLETLPEVGNSGSLYITTDEGAIYLGTGSGMKRLGDFIQVADVASLPASAHESALYYCVAENVLAKWNGSGWSQINKDTGAIAASVTGDGNAVTAAEYDAATRTIKLTKGATYATPAVVDSKISTAVGELGNDAQGTAYANVKAYVDAKTTGIATDAALSALQQDLDAAEAKIEALEAANAEGGVVANAIASAQSAADDAQAAADKAQGEVDALETVVSEYKTANDAAVAAAKKAGDDAQVDVDALYDIVGEVEEGKTVVEMIADAQSAATYDDEEVRGLISDNAAAIDEIEKDYLKAADKTELSNAIALKADKSVVDEIVADYLKAADKTELEGKITAEENARKAADQALDDRLVEVEAFFKLAEGESLDTALDTLKEIQTYITTEGSAADQMVKDIEDNAKAIEDLDAEIGNAAEGDTAATGLYKVIADADKALSDRIDAIHDHENKAVLDGITAAKVEAWDKAEENAIAHADGLNGAMDTRVKALEAIDHEHANKELLDTYTQTEANLADAVAKKHEHENKTVLDGITAEKVAAWDSAEGNAKAHADQIVADAVIDAANKDAVVLAEAQKGIEAVQTTLNTHADNGDIHITAAERTAWSAAEQNAKDYAKGLSDALEGQLTWGSF